MAHEPESAVKRDWHVEVSRIKGASGRRVSGQTGSVEKKLRLVSEGKRLVKASVAPSMRGGDLAL